MVDVKKILLIAGGFLGGYLLYSLIKKATGAFGVPLPPEAITPLEEEKEFVIG